MCVMKPAIVTFISTVLTSCLLPNVSSSSVNSAEIVASSSSTPIVASTFPEYLQGKSDSLFSCQLISLELGEYELFPNGTLHIEAYNASLNENLYIHLNDTVMFCPPFSGSHGTKKVVSKQEYMTVTGLIISLICLILHLVAFAFVPDMRNLPGWNLAALCLSLLCSYFLLILVWSDTVTKHRDICVAVASLTHFFLLSSFLWMSIISYDVFKSLRRATGKLRTSSTQFRPKTFAMYNLCAFGIALIVSVLTILADVIDVVPKSFKPEFAELCWFSQKTPLEIFFAGPVIILTCINFIFFVLSAYTIRSNDMNSETDSIQTSLRRNYSMYFRLFVIMGITWTLGIVAACANEDWVWYLFVFLNTLQGLFIFLAFTWSEKVKKYLRQKLMGGRNQSELNLSPAYELYCLNRNSLNEHRQGRKQLNSRN